MTGVIIRRGMFGRQTWREDGHVRMGVVLDASTSQGMAGSARSCKQQGRTLLTGSRGRLVLPTPCF